MRRESKILRQKTELSFLELSDGSEVTVNFVRVVGLELHIDLTHTPSDYDIISDEPDTTTMEVDGVSVMDLPVSYVEMVLEAVNEALKYTDVKL